MIPQKIYVKRRIKDFHLGKFSLWCTAEMWGCQHPRMIAIDNGAYIDIQSGSTIKGHWENLVGPAVELNDHIVCDMCTSKEYVKILDALGPEIIEKFANQEEVLKAHPKAAWHEYGPVFEQDGKDILEVYLGAHEWAFFDIADSRKPVDSVITFDQNRKPKYYGYIPYDGLGWRYRCEKDLLSAESFI